MRKSLRQQRHLRCVVNNLQTNKGTGCKLKNSKSLRTTLGGIVLMLATLFCSSCTDDIFTNLFGSDTVEVEIDLVMPGTSDAATRAMKTRVSGDNQTTNGKTEYTELQRYIGDGDVYVLVFEVVSEDEGEDILYAVPDINISGENGNVIRYVTFSLTKTDVQKKLKVDVVTNLAQNGFGNSTSEAISKLSGYINNKRSDVYEQIGNFIYPKANTDTDADDYNPYGVWTLSEEDGGRYLPMWGSSSSTLSLSNSSDDTWWTECDLYRSVAKMGVSVDNQCDNFILKEVYVYYINEEGKFISS